MIITQRAHEIKRSPAMIPVNTADEMILIRAKNSTNSSKDSEQRIVDWIKMSDKERALNDEQAGSELKDKMERAGEFKERFAKVS